MKTYFNEEYGITEYDMECYKSPLRHFRMVGCTKRGKNAFLEINSFGHTDLDAMICHISKNCKFVNIDKRVIKKNKSIVPLIHNEERIHDLNALLLENLHLFASESVDYYTWLTFSIAIYKAGLPFETFLEFSKLDDEK